MIEAIEKTQELKLKKSSWKLTKLGDLAEDISKRVDNPSASSYDRFVGLEHFVSGDIKIKNWGSTENLASSAKAFQAGDILFARRNAYLRRASIVDFDGCCSGDAFVIRENHNKVVPGFLAFLMNSDALWDYANSNAAGTMSKRVKWRDLAEYEFLLPPKEEQSKLAELLWAMDEVIEREKVVLERHENVFLSYSDLIFSNGIGNFIELSKIGTLIMGQSPDGGTYNEDENGMPFLQGNAEFGDISPKFVKYTTEPNKIAPKNSILISVRAPVGDLNIANREYCIGRGLAALFIENESLRNYVFNFLKYSKTELDKRSTGSTFKAVNKDALSTLKLRMPTEKVIQENSNKLSVILSTIENSKSKINSSLSLQKSIINQVF
jgi:type I restriction enzyme S subunit